MSTRREDIDAWVAGIKPDPGTLADFSEFIAEEHWTPEMRARIEARRAYHANRAIAQAALDALDEQERERLGDGQE